MNAYWAGVASDVYSLCTVIVVYSLRRHHKQSSLSFPRIFNLHSFCLYSLWNWA